jgi:hypothetical protein
VTLNYASPIIRFADDLSKYVSEGNKTMPDFTRFDVDKLTSMEDDYPHDPNVPDLPPVPDAVNPPPPRDNWNWTRFNDDVHP